MNKLEQVYTQCNICGRDILYGNAILEIQRNVEQHNYVEETGLRIGTVTDAVLLLSSCASCGNYLSNSKKLRMLMVSKLGIPGSVSNEYKANHSEINLPDTCDCCGKELKIGKTRVSLAKLIGQMDWSDKCYDGELSVIDGDDILSFCKNCGKKMSSYRMQQALKMVLEDLVVPERTEETIWAQHPELHGTPQHPVKILHITAEGGDITLYGWKDNGGEWRFSRENNESALYGEDTHDHDVDVAPGWHGALELLNGNPWYRHIPVYVHPEFAEQTMEALHNVPEENQTQIDYEAWQAVCVGKRGGGN